MAIAFDAATNSGNSSGTTKTFAHTCGSGANRILFVGCYGGSTDILTGITYGGVAMTFLEKQTVGFGDRYIYLYYLLNPASGANNVVISFSSSENCAADAVSYTGALQSGVPDAHNNWQDAFVTSISHSLTTVADNCWIVFLAKTNGAGNPTADTGLTVRGAGNSMSIFDSNSAITPAGSYTMGVSDGASAVWASLAVSFAPAVTVKLKRNSTLNGLGASGPFFHNPIG